jgi:antirestriction protein
MNDAYNEAMEEHRDPREEAYASLAEEASVESAHPWKDEDWDAEAVEMAKEFAAENDLSWPPGLNAFDTYYDRKHNPD